LTEAKVNPIFQWIKAHTTAKALVRHCPKCRQAQAVPKEQAKETVPCRRCGEPLPPKEKNR